jgi:aromatic-L-amino-acid decarboxylase
MAETTRRGRVMITGAMARGRYLGRVCVLSFRTHQDRIDALVEDLREAIGDIAGSR